MTMRLLSVFCLTLAMRIAATAQTPGTIVRLDPAFDAIVPAGATVETLKEGFGFINGILWVRDGSAGHLLVSDIPANVIHTWTPPNTMTVFLDRPDWTRVAEARPAGVRFGANGIARDPQGRIVYAAEADRAVVRLEPDGKRTIIAERYEGKRLNSPNDLVFRKDGSLYFTDPSGGGRFGTWDVKKELPYQGVFLLKDGKLQLLVQDLDRPNGIVAVAGREVAVRQRFEQARDHALRRAARRHRGQRPAVRRYEHGEGERQPRRDEVRRARQSLFGRARRDLGHQPGGEADRPHRAARKCARLRVWRPRSEGDLHGRQLEAGQNQVECGGRRARPYNASTRNSRPACSSTPASSLRASLP